MATPPDFSVGQVLTAAHMDAVGLWRVTTCTVTSVGGTAATASNGVITVGAGNTSVTVSNAFSADFESYKILYTGGVGSADALINLAFPGSTTGYYAARTLAKYSDGTLLGGNTNNGASWGGVGVCSTSGAVVNVDLLNPFVSTARTFFNGHYSAAITADYAGSTGGYHNVTASYTGFTLTLSSGSLTGGTIRVYGYRN